MSYDRHLADIAREFPGWTIWRSDAGRWWATRHQPLTAAQRDAGYAMTIDADDPEGLREQLLDQRDLGRPAPGHGDTGRRDPGRHGSGEHGPGESGPGRRGPGESGAGESGSDRREPE